MKLMLTTVLIICAIVSPAQIVPLPNAHAHNDYEHKRPLYDALENGFTSVEADVYLIEGVFYVYHDLPTVLDKSRTLENLYLNPLKKIIRENEGYVYSGYKDFFYLMIDIKSEAKPAYEQMKKVLAKYKDFISTVKQGQEEADKPIKIFLSGSISGGPYDEILKEELLLTGVDGRPKDLGKGIPTSAMPVVSDHYRRFLSWSGKGVVNEKEKEKL